MTTTKYDEQLARKYRDADTNRERQPHQSMAYETWIQEMPPLQNLDVLDLACGSGVSTRRIAVEGARVTGIDISEEMLCEARKHPDTDKLNIIYAYADCSKALPNTTAVDLSTSVYMFNYADNTEMLCGFAKGLMQNLKPGGHMVSIAVNPSMPNIEYVPGISQVWKWIDTPLKDGSQYSVEILDMDGKVTFSLVTRYWSKLAHEKALEAAGFREIEWIPLRMTTEGKKLNDWKYLEEHTLGIVLKARA